MNSCKIIMYHYVRSIKNSKYPKIKGLEIDGFIRQIEYFKKKFSFITANELIDSIYENKEISKKSILLTFDDGLKEHYDYVFPVLKKYNIQGLFFPSVKPIEENIIVNVHKIQHVLATYPQLSKLKNELCELMIKHRKEFGLKNPEEYNLELMKNRYDTEDITYIKSCLQFGLPEKARNYFVDYFFKKYVTKKQSEFSKKFYLSIENMKEMVENGMYVGSHAYSHEWLEYLDEETLDFEILKSIRFYQKINKSNNNYIMCYPSGSYNKKVIEKLKKYKFKAGLTLKVGDANLNKENAFTLERLDTNDFPQ